MSTRRSENAPAARSMWLSRLGLRLSPSEEAFISEWSSWLDDHEEMAHAVRARGGNRIARLRTWQAALEESRWVSIGWPAEFGGRDATFVEQLLYHVEATERRLPSVVGRIGLNLCGPTLIAHGTPEQQSRFLPRLRRGDDIWCQGFSEPEAGSDLAGLRTRGEVKDDMIVINGQKVWTSGAQYADWMFALVRTDPSAPKRAGISFVLIPMSAPGITVRPIKQISGDSEFNEVFLDGVQVPLGNVVGPLNEGWRVARTTLANERAILFISRQVILARLVDRIVRLAKATAANGVPRSEDPDIRRRIASAWIDAQLIRVNGTRSLGQALRGAEPGPGAAMSKLFGQETEQRLYELALDVGGVTALTAGSTTGSSAGRWSTGWLRTRASTIGGGTSEIQRNILAEKVLGQPRDLWADE